MLVAAVLATVGFAVINNGQSEQKLLEAAPSSCDIVEMMGVQPSSTEAAECEDRDNKGKGKILDGQILLGAAGLGLIVAFVLPKPST